MPEKVTQKKNEVTVQGAVGEPRRKSEYEVPSTTNKLVNNYFKPTSNSHVTQISNTMDINQQQVP